MQRQLIACKAEQLNAVDEEEKRQKDVRRQRREQHLSQSAAALACDRPGSESHAVNRVAETCPILVHCM